jgi:subfamily B ATP-binding cassette protein MsbA
MEALEAANLAALMREMPEGIDTQIGDNGNRLSGGQRQRLAIARAIYKDAPILILDEATSALDSESERQVQDALEHLMAGRTTLVIAHRLSTIEHADRIVVLEHGHVIENGSHEELIAKDGLYANLHRIQFSNA